MYNSNNNKQLTKSNPLSLGRHEKQPLLFSLVHLILWYMV